MSTTADEHLTEMARQCMQATPLGRLSMGEALRVFAWLLDNGHMARTGQTLERPRVLPKAVARTTEGAPIYDAGADHRTHDTVEMK
jgi:hypothetical protein